MVAAGAVPGPPPANRERGGYSLTRFRTDEGGEREAWLLVKHADERAGSDGDGTPEARRARSARTGRTLGQVEAEAAAQVGDPA